jgi:hypothetical protein
VPYCTYKNAAASSPPAALLIHPPSKGDASNEGTAPGRRRRPIRRIWVFTREGERRGWEIYLNDATEKGNDTPRRHRCDQPSVRGFPRSRLPSPPPKQALGPASAGIEPAGWEQRSREAAVFRSEAEVDGNLHNTTSILCLFATRAAEEDGPQHWRAPLPPATPPSP